MINFRKTVIDRWQDSLNLILGLWLIVSPWALQFTGIQAALWNAVILGVILAAAALAALVRFHEWEEWADMAFGLWLVISPWLLGFGTTTAAVPEGAAAVTGAFAATWNFVVVGLLTIAFAAWSLRDERHRMTHA